MKLTKSKWLNLIILKIVEGLGIVFIPYWIGRVPLLVWPKLSGHSAFDSVLDLWFFGIILIVGPILIAALIWVIIRQNLDLAEDLKRDK